MPTKSRSTSARSAAAKKSSRSASSKTPRRRASKRELIAPNNDKRYVRRSAAGQFKESDDVGRSLSQDRRRSAKTKAKPGQGDRGDR